MTEAITTDPKRELEGVWNDYGPFQVKLARLGGANEAAVRELALQSGQFNIDKMKPNQADTAIRQVLVRCLIKGWQTRVDDEWRDGIAINDGGTILPASRKNMLRRLTDWPQLAHALFQNSQDVQTYAAKSTPYESGEPAQLES